MSKCQHWKMFDFNNFPDKIESDELNSPGGGGGYVNSVTFSDDEDKLAIGVYDGAAKGCCIYNANGTKILCTFCKGEEVLKFIFSPNKMILTAGCVGKVHLFNVVTGDCLHTFPIKGASNPIPIQ